MCQTLILKGSLKSISVNKQDALEQLPKKLKNERRVKREIRALLNEMAREAFIVFSAVGMSPDFSQFVPEMEALLKRNYRITSRDFKFFSRDKFGLSRNTRAIEIDTMIADYINENAKRRAGFIVNTTSKEFQGIVNKVIDEAEDILTSEEIAARATVEMRRRNIIRSTSIAADEVQHIAEAAKTSEAVQISENVFPLKKEWNTLLDQVTRETHVMADGQLRNIEEPFLVGGAMLRFPGDTSLGAPKKETMRCRCSVSTEKA